MLLRTPFVGSRAGPQAQGKYWEVAGTALGNVLGIKSADDDGRHCPAPCARHVHASRRVRTHLGTVSPPLRGAAKPAPVVPDGPVVVTSSSKTIKEQACSDNPKRERLACRPANTFAHVPYARFLQREYLPVFAIRGELMRIIREHQGTQRRR